VTVILTVLCDVLMEMKRRSWFCKLMPRYRSTCETFWAFPVEPGVYCTEAVVTKEVKLFSVIDSLTKY